jgi:hypothetical protein
VALATSAQDLTEQGGHPCRPIRYNCG